MEQEYRLVWFCLNKAYQIDLNIKKRIHMDKIKKYCLVI